MQVKIPDYSMYNKIPIKGCAFNSTKKNEYPLLTESDRGVFIFCIELNGGNGHVYDVVYVNGYTISKTKRWGHMNLKKLQKMQLLIL